MTDQNAGTAPAPDTTPGDDDLVEVPTEDSVAAPDGASDGHPHGQGHHRGGILGLGLAAIGVVFGDIGTSPLYSLQTVFSINNGAIKPTEDNIFGVISMALWAITLIVSLKYVSIVMRADNDGEGGILALVALIKDRLRGGRAMFLAILIGILGAGLFYGDSVITPAISVMSAIEGLHVVNPAFEHLVLPLSVVILTVLFMVQRFGTAKVGTAFGPIMLLWFVTLGVLGVPHIIENPHILGAVSPHHAVAFAVAHPLIAFFAMGAVVLTFTGAEALYADMGHFGARPIRLAWFCVVFPSLLLCYLGQGAMLLDHPDYIDNPFFRLAPEALTIVLVIMATLATVIASQAVISGAFSVSRQASRLRLLPRLTVKHTSKSEGGQIYIGSVNWLLFFGVLLLISIFQTSARLASAYGLAVTGTEILTTSMLLVYARKVWRWPLWAIGIYIAVIGFIEATFFAANLLKLPTGGWIPLVIAGFVIIVMTTWRRGVELAAARRAKLEGPLDEFLAKVAEHDAHVNRVPGFAVFPHGGKETVPLALKDNLLFNRVLHHDILIVQIVNENVPHIRHVDRETFDNLGDDRNDIAYVTCRVGFNDSQDVPKAVKLAIETFPQLAHLKEEDAMYFLSVADIKRNDESHRMPRWRKRIFQALSKAQADVNDTYHTPKERTIVMGAELFI